MKGCKLCCKWAASLEGKEGGWKEQGRKRWRETQKHSLGADQVLLLIGPSVCVCVPTVGIGYGCHDCQCY